MNSFAVSHGSAQGLTSRGSLPALEVVDSLTSLSGPIDALVVPVFRGETGIELAGGPSPVLNSEQEIELWKLLTSVGAQGTAGELTTLPGAVLSTPRAGAGNSGNSTTDSSSDATSDAPHGPEVHKILAIGLGEVEALSDEDIRQAAGTVSRAATGMSVVVSTLGLFSQEGALLGHALGAYTYSGQKSDPGKPAVKRIVVVGSDDSDAAVKRATTIAQAVAFARDLVNAPGNELYPSSYADILREAAEGIGLDVEVLDDSELERQGFGGIVGVGKGSVHPPRLVRISYRPSRATDSTPHVALVGKGVTFDTGGISLKPGAKMWDMISDMGGSAAVAGAIFAAAELKLNVRVTATIPLAENMPSGHAIRPGDILRHYGGTTTEVLNTDAEGRLILADAIVRACEDDPDYLIETATLTGAQLVALGDRTPGIMGSLAFRDKVALLSQEVGENGWPMPLPAELGEAIKGDVSDLKNISDSRWGGMSVAGHYLSNFVADGVEWVHLDVAGPAYNTGAPHGYTPRRATGVPLRTIVAVLEHIAQSATN